MDHGQKAPLDLLFSVTANFTAEPLEEVLKFWLAKLELQSARTIFSGYNQLFQEAIAPAGLLRSKTLGANFLLVRLEDWARDQSFERRCEAVTETMREFLGVVSDLGGRTSRPTLLFLCPISQAAGKDSKFRDCLVGLQEEFKATVSCLRGITLISPEEVAAIYPVDVVEDEESNHQGHIPFSRGYWVAIGTMLIRTVRPLIQPPCKVAVVDADNTLWGGVVGELGAEGVHLGRPWQVFQQFLRRLKQRGVLLALASKNEEFDVASVFRQPEMVLRREDFVSWKVNWEPKSKNISALAEELEFGLDAIVFIDDNPLECAEVTANCPGVITYQFPQDPNRTIDFVNHLWALDVGRTTSVDEVRTELYRQQSERTQFRRAASSFQEFISGLRLQVDIKPPMASQIERAAQLTQRTNQFNASGLRRTADELTQLMQSGERQAMLVSARDRFGDYGEVGLAVYYREQDSLVLETLLMSCRVLGKGVEHQLIARIGSEAEGLGLKNLRIPFRRTDRNRPAESFLTAIGAAKGDDSSFWMLARSAAEMTFCPIEEAGIEPPTESGVAKPARSIRPDFSSIAAELRSVEEILECIDAMLQHARPELPEKLIRPRNELESRLATIWESVLHIPEVGIKDRFLDLGGKSLQAAGIAARIGAEFGVRIPLDVLLANTTIEHLAEYLEGVHRTVTSLTKANELRLSPAQQRLWFLNQLIPTRSAYNIPLARRIQGPLRLDALKTALSHLVARHDLLRSTYSSEGGAAALRISDGVNPDFRHVRVDSEVQALAAAAEEACHPFDLTKDSLLRCLVASWSETSHVLILTAHHIVSDGWSSGLLLRDLSEAYEAVALDRMPTWSRLSSSYVDYASWLDKRQRAGEFASDLVYWSRELQGAPTLLELPLDKSRPAVMSYRGESVVGYLSLATQRRLEALAGRAGCTPFAVLLAAWQTLLYRYSHQDDIVVGVPVAGRTHPALESLVGCFVNTVAIRSRIDGQASFQVHLSATRDKLVEALAHQEVPFETLVAELGVERNLSRSPLFQTMLVLQEFQLGDFQPNSLTVSAFPLHNKGAKFDLLMEVTPVAEGYQLVLEYNTDLFVPETARRILNHFLLLLNNSIVHPETAVDDLSILSEVERNELVQGFNSSDDQALPYNAALHELIESQVDRDPGAVAMRFAGKSLTYGEMNARANQVAHYLRRLGVGRGAFVGVFIERSFEMVIGLLGILKAGGAYVPIDPEYPAERVAFMIQDSSAPVLLAQHRLCAQLPSYDGTVICLDTEWNRIDQESRSNPPNITTPDDLAYMIYTSGSTGMPKGAMNAHVGICNRLLWMQKQFQINESDAVLQKTPFSFDVSVWELFWPLLVGAQLVIAKPGGHRDPAYLVDVIAGERVTVMHFVPSMLGAFLAAPGLEQCQLLRHVMCSGEALPFSLQEEFFARLPAQLHNLYGPTEAAVDVTYWTCRPHDERKLVPIGRPVANTQMYILDRRLQPVPVGVAGELYIGGIQVGKGYHNRPELTEERFIPDHLGGRAGGRLYKTGDLARFLPEGEIEYLGRSDFQVKIRGFRIELGEIEASLCRHPAIREAVVTAREDVPGMKRLVAYIVTALTEADLDAIRDHLKATLPEFMIPAAFVFMRTFPLSPNGKIDRKLLPVPMQGQNATRDYVAPRTGTEQTLAEVWSRVLRVERVGIHDNFFELGGDSILSIQVISMARRHGWKITPTMFFSNQTIAELAAAAIAALDPQPNEDLADGEVELTPIQHWFFEQHLEDGHHFNQAVLFDVITPLDRSIVESTLKELNGRHDALRLRCHHDGRHWHQRYVAGDESELLRWVDLTAVSSQQQGFQIEEMAAATQATLDLAHGPIWRVVYFQTHDAGMDRMLFVVHHVAIDGVSWGILLEDFEYAYQRLQEGGAVQWSAKTTSYKAWAKQLQVVSKSETFLKELPSWIAVTDPNAMRGTTDCLVTSPDENREAGTNTIHTVFTAEDTQALLKEVPSVYNTQVNDVLLAALARAWSRWSGSRLLLTDLEGHGREDVGGDLDISRTVGWFTSIFPVKLECPENGDDWRPDVTLKAVKEQLRRIPQRGIGYGVLRYLVGDPTLAKGASAPMVFNYFGQFDQVLSGSRLFRFGSESSGPWHSPNQRRRYVLEVNALVLGGRLEVRWTYPRSLRTAKDVELLAGEYKAALRAIIVHCQSPTAGGRTPSDFPLAGLDQASVDRLLANCPDAEDVYPLSPIQSLFFATADMARGVTFDQWHCTLDGSLQVQTFQRAWSETIQRHTVLRSTIHSEGLREPVQVVHRVVQPSWSFEDWRGMSFDEADVRWRDLLKRDQAKPLLLTEPPVMRFTLVRIDEQKWRLLWSVPALLLDGWSWPLVFRDVSRAYEALDEGQPVSLEVVRPYRDYIEWLNRQSQEAALGFWKESLHGVLKPTDVQGQAESSEVQSTERYFEQVVSLPAGILPKLQTLARGLHVTLNTIVQSAWALFLSRQSGQQDVVFGASFSARPTDLAGAEAIVGPFVNNLPIRISIRPSAKIREILCQVQGTLLKLLPYQYTPLVKIQGVSDVPFRYRLFDSVVVFQNYLVDESARRLGRHIVLSDFAGPVHTSFPVLLLAEPGSDLRLTLVCDNRRVGRDTRARWARDLAILFERLSDSIEGDVAGLLSALSLPVTSDTRAIQKLGTRAAYVVAPQSKMEQMIVGVWQQLFGFDQISVEDNFFDLGGHSMLLVQLHGRLCEALHLDFPMVKLLQYPSIRSLARYFEKPALDGVIEGDHLRDRAKKQKEALDRSKSMGRKR